MRWVQPHNTERVRQWIRRVNAVKTWQMAVILLLGLLVAATLLRLNNLGMVERRQAVVAADEKGDPETIRSSLVELQRYVSSHMNTDLDKGVYLVKEYERDRDAAIAAASNASNPQSAVYQQASVECRARFQGGSESFRNDYVQCVLERVSALSGGAEASSAQLPHAEAYRFDYVSPLWSLDLAGFSVLFCVLVTGVIIGRLVALGALHLLLRRRYRSL